MLERRWRVQGGIQPGCLDLSEERLAAATIELAFPARLQLISVYYQGFFYCSLSKAVWKEKGTPTPTLLLRIHKDLSVFSILVNYLAQTWLILYLSQWTTSLDIYHENFWLENCMSPFNACLPLIPKLMGLFLQFTCHGRNYLWIPMLQMRHWRWQSGHKIKF